MRKSPLFRIILSITLSFAAVAPALSTRAFQAGSVQVTEIKGFVYADGGFVLPLTTASTAYFSNFNSSGYGDFGWQIVNTTGATLQNARLIVLLDAELDHDTTTFFNEYGALINLSLMPAAAGNDIAPSTWEIDEPGFLFGNIIPNLGGDIPDQTNGVPAGAPDDVSLALGFQLGDLAPGSQAIANLFISQTNIGGLSQTDSETGNTFYFNGFIHLNTPPAISAASIIRQEGVSASSGTIATVNDIESGPTGVTVTVTSSNPANGVTVSNIVNTGGTITADVGAACGATNAGFTLTAVDGNGASQTAILNVTVVASPPALTPAFGTFTIAGGTGTVQVGQPAGCAWTAVSNNPDWITVTSGMQGSGNGMVGYTVAAIDSGTPRQGSINIGGQNFPVSQIILEADSAQRPNGNGNIVVSDWVQVGRFSVGLDTPAPGAEFQRADCAPRSTLGDARITVADWVQAGRYSVGLDPWLEAGGPTEMALSTPFTNPLTPEPRVLRIAGQMVSSRQTEVIVPVELIARGGENGLTFSLQFDPSALSFQDIRAVKDGVIVVIQAKDVNAGRLGVGMILSPGTAFDAGVHEILRVRFKTSGRQATLVSIGDGPAPIGLAGVNAMTLPVKAVDGVIRNESPILSGEENSRSASARVLQKK